MTDHEKEIIKYRFGIYGGYARTLKEVSKILNISKERVRFLEDSALHKLQNAENKESVSDFMICAGSC